MTDLVGFVEQTLGRTAAARDVRLPDVAGGAPLSVAGVWTTDGTRTRWDNLLAAVTNAADDGQWATRADAWRLQLLVLPSPSGAGLRIVDRSPPSGAVDQTYSSPHHAEPALRAARDRLFAPETLSRLRGELPLDLDHTIGATGFASKQRNDLSQALVASITDALENMGISVEQHRRGSNRPRSPLKRHERHLIGHVTRVAVAYLGARVLEDKGFWKGRARPTNDPDKLIREATTRTNGFFKAARDDSLAALQGQHAALQALAKHLGGGRSFALVDDQDVGDWYELALTALPPEVAQEDEFKDLQQHYTPVGIARRILEHLPLERIPVRERFVFDPAAGSGSLLLAATRRLAEMRDAPADVDARRAWLRAMVSGNDIDPRARMITGLRYTLVREALGDACPIEVPVHFGSVDYRNLTHHDLAALTGGPPRVLIANPPYAEEREHRSGRDVQIASIFVERALSWLREGDLFGLVLPQTFLTQSSHGVGAARSALAARADVFECWQLREGIVGTSARQEVCVVLGTIGRARYSGTVARKVQTNAEVKTVARVGYIGPSWYGKLDGDDWSQLVDPPVRARNLAAATVDDLYRIFCGPTRKPGTKPVESAPPSQRLPYFDLMWQPNNTVSLSPGNVPAAQRYRRRDDLKRDAKLSARNFERPKLVAYTSNNRATESALPVFLDRNGFWPDKVVHCVVVRQDAKTSLAPEGWVALSEEDRLLWLLAILRSDVGRGFIESRRSSRNTNKNTLSKIPLPATVSENLIKAMRDWDDDSQGAAGYLAIVNREVSRAYGAQAPALARVGADPQLRIWEAESARSARPVKGQITSVPEDGRIRTHITTVGMPKGGIEGYWPQGLPGWALAGPWFEAALSEDVSSVAELRERPWALRHFRHPTLEELGSLAYGFLPLGHAPSPPISGVMEEIKAFQSIEEERELTPDERQHLEMLHHKIEEQQERSPREQERRRREAARAKEIDDLLGQLRRSKT